MSELVWIQLLTWIVWFISFGPATWQCSVKLVKFNSFQDYPFWIIMDKECSITVVILCTFSVFLPIADTYSDIFFAYTLMLNGHVHWGMIFLVIIVLHTVIIFLVWTYYEPRKEKVYTWILVILNLWISYKGALQINFVWFNEYHH